MIIQYWCDSDHAGDKVSRISRSGLFMMINLVPKCWFSNKQSIIQTIMYRRELFFMKKCCEYLWLLRYKMWMMGIIVDKPLFVEKINWYLRTPGKTDSILKKKTCVIAYHCVCEGCRYTIFYTHPTCTPHTHSDIQ